MTFNLQQHATQKKYKEWNYKIEKGLGLFSVSCSE